jgi:hypothetical protein
MKKLKELLIQNKLYIIIAILVIFIVALPLTKKGTPIGDDFGFQYSRIEGIADGLREHNFPVKISSKHCNTYTYGEGFFYCNFFFYIPAILKIMSIPSEIIAKTFMILIASIIMLNMFISVKHITKNKKVSLLAAIVLSTSFYYLANLYYRVALGECLGLAFTPLVIAGIWDFVYNEFKKPQYIIIGFIGVIFSHVISTIIAVIFCVIFVLINIRKIFKDNKIKILKLILAAIVVALITMCYWLPMLEQLGAQTYKFQVSPFSHAYDITTNLYEIFGDKYEGGSGFGVVQASLLMINFFIIIKNWKNISRDTKQIFFIGLCFILVVPTQKFWATFKVLDIIQFPWRLCGIATILNSIVFARIFLDEFKNFEEDKILMIIAGICILATLASSKQLLRFTTLSENWYELPISIGGGKEYLPANSIIDEGVEIDWEKVNSPNTALNEKNEKIEGVKNSLEFTFENEIDDESYLIPFFYYKGYKAKLIKDSGEEINLEVSLGDGGLVKVENIKEKGTIVVWYNTTFIQKLSYIISFSSTLVIVLIIIFKFIYNIYKKNKNKNLNLLK